MPPEVLVDGQTGGKLEKMLAAARRKHPWIRSVTKWDTNVEKGTLLRMLSYEGRGMPGEPAIWRKQKKFRYPK